MDEFNEAMQLILMVSQILESKWQYPRSAMERVVLLKLEEASLKMENVDNMYRDLAQEVRRIEGD
jgi:hypothetical protein